MIKKFLEHLPLNRCLTYLVFLGFVPLAFAVLHYVKQKREWDIVSEQIMATRYLSETKAQKQYINSSVRAVYSEADQFYLENQLESLPLLKKEKENLEHLLNSPTFTGNEAAEKRYARLSSQVNRFEFLQGNVQSAENIQEAVCTLAHPVEIDTYDLKEILSRIEGNRKGKPQLIVTDFKLIKKTQPSGNEVFELNMKLLRREFHL